MGTITLLVLRSVAWAYFAQPAVFRRLWGNLLGHLLKATGTRAKVVQQNLELAFPGQSKDALEARARLSTEAYLHLGNLILDAIMLLGPLKHFVPKNCEVRGIENWKEAHQKGRGVIFLSSHVGNWEIMAACAPLIAKIDLMLVTKRLKPAWLHQAIEQGRLAYGVKATYEPRTMNDILNHLKSQGTVGFVLDQYAGPPVGVRVPVFGVPVSTSTAAATLAKRTGAPVLPVVCYRLADGRWVVEVGKAFEWQNHSDPNYELAANTALYASQVEKYIYAHPDQWLWTHRRFKGDLSPLREGEWNQGRVRR